MSESWFLSDVEFMERIAKYPTEDYGDGPDAKPMFPIGYLLYAAQDSIMRYDHFAEMIVNHANRVQPGCTQFRKHVEHWRSEISDISTRIGRIVFQFSEIMANPHSGTATALPLMCGYGKSSAIRMLIKRAIEALTSVPDENGDGTVSYTGDGMVIVTDSIDRISDYLHDEQDTDLDVFLQMHSDRFITMMTSAEIQQAYKVQYYKPILIMTTQRYFMMSPSEINQLLTWQGGPRPIIIIDEKPILNEVIEVGHADINDVSSALLDGISPSEERDWCIAQWENLRTRFFTHMSECEANVRSGESKDFYFAREQEIMTEDDVRFIRFVEHNRDDLNSYSSRRKAQDPYKVIKAVQAVMTNGAIYHCSKTAIYKDCFSILVDNSRNISEVHAHVVILDATSDLHPDYDNQESISIVNRFDYGRSLAGLKLRFVDYPGTSKASMIQPDKKAAKRTLRFFEQESINKEEVPCLPIWIVRNSTKREASKKPAISEISREKTNIGRHRKLSRLG